MSVMMPVAPAAPAPVHRHTSRSTGDSFAATLAAAADGGQDRAQVADRQTGAAVGSADPRTGGQTAGDVPNEQIGETADGPTAGTDETRPWLQGAAELPPTGQSPTDEAAEQLPAEQTEDAATDDDAATDEVGATAPDGTAPGDVTDPAAPTAAMAAAGAQQATMSAATASAAVATGGPADTADATPTGSRPAAGPGAPASPAAHGALAGTPPTTAAPATPGAVSPALAAAGPETTGTAQIDSALDAEASRPGLTPERPAPGAEATARGIEVLQPATRTEGVAKATPAQAPPAPLPQPPPLSGQLATALSRLTTAPEGHHVLNILVDPEDLGPVRVSAHIGAEGVRIELVGMTDAAKESLRGALSELRRELAATGLNADLDLGSDESPTERPQHGRPVLGSRGEAAPAETPPDPRATPLGGRGLDLLA